MCDCNIRRKLGSSTQENQKKRFGYNLLSKRMEEENVRMWSCVIIPGLCSYRSMDGSGVNSASGI